MVVIKKALAYKVKYYTHRILHGLCKTIITSLEGIWKP